MERVDAEPFTDGGNDAVVRLPGPRWWRRESVATWAKPGTLPAVYWRVSTLC
ncbi:DUF6959 family protein [Streptomyces sp. NPDC005525]|uniref:DUF6959 family protein n=1 Tax=Streptomyces sp. NPDC005525 TaxID=3364720 RepID=UPI00367636FC